MPRSKLRRPASTWTTGVSIFDATSAHANVEFTSPTTTTAAGRSRCTKGSKRFMTSAVCWACDPERTSRFSSGARIPRSSNRRSFNIGS
jgi:hypothetical protein